MEGFIEINPFNRKHKNYEDKKDKFIENPIGSNYMKLEFGEVPKVNVNKIIKFTEKK